MPLSYFIMALFVGDLASVCAEADLVSVFSQFGSVEEAKLIRDAQTKRSLMYGFVTMENNAQSEKAIAELDGEFLFGRRMK
jgi:RNA recognition motif-containing protein